MMITVYKLWWISFDTLEIYFKYGAKIHFSREICPHFPKVVFLFPHAWKIWFMKASYTKKYMCGKCLKFLKWKVYFFLEKNEVKFEELFQKLLLKIMMLLYPITLHHHKRKMESKFQVGFLFMLWGFYLPIIAISRWGNAF